jgi:diguanylate cyclase (GGDEF)-like protein
VDDLRRRNRLLLLLQIGLAATSCVWGAVVLLPGVSSQLEVLTVQALCLAVAGIFSVHNLSYHRGCLVLFSLGLALPTLLATIMQGFPAHLGAAGLALVAVTQIYGWSTRNLMFNVIGTNIMNEQMTTELRHSHDELTKAMQRLHQLATRDPLTQCLNRRALMDEMHRELARCERHHSSFALIMLDLDHFKSINDRYGHGIGDAVLTDAAARLSTQLRSTDLLGRWGGEEFLCLLTQTDPLAALQKAETLRQALANPAVNVPGAALEVTASIGVAVYRPGQTLEEIIDAADQALYRAKRAGRNQVCC